MILNNAAELLPLEMKSGSSVTSIFIILISKFNSKVGQPPHMWECIVGQMYPTFLGNIYNNNCKQWGFLLCNGSSAQQINDLDHDFCMLVERADVLHSYSIFYTFNIWPNPNVDHVPNESSYTNYIGLF